MARLTPILVLCFAAAALAVQPGDVQRVQADLRNGQPGAWVDVPVTPQVAAAIAAALPATAPGPPPSPPPAPPPPAPPPVPGDGSRLVRSGEDPGPIAPGERVRLQRGGVYRCNLYPSSRCYLGAYGTGPNPLIAGGHSVIFQAPAGQVIDSPTIEDLDVICEQGIEGDPAFDLHRADWVGFNVVSPIAGLTMRRCTARGFAYGFCTNHTTEVLRVRCQGGTIEDCDFSDNWSLTTYHGQGAYFAAWDDLTVVRPVLCGNGYVPGDEGTPRGWCHGIYGQGGKVQWGLPEGCRRLKVLDAIAIHNAAWGVMNRSDGGETSVGFFCGNAVGLALSGPLPVRAAGNVIVAGHVAKTTQSFGAGGIDFRAAAGELRDNLLILPPENRPKDKNWQKPAFEPNPGKRINAADPTYVGKVQVTGGANNAALGWPKDVTVWGSPVPGLRTGPAPAADWSWLDDYERRARKGEATAAEGVARVRQSIGGK